MSCRGPSPPPSYLHVYSTRGAEESSAAQPLQPLSVICLQLRARYAW
jgi:hypothetical protein